MTYRAIPAALLCLCASLPATAADLAFSLGGAVEYDDNVFRREDHTEDDVFFRVIPGVSLTEERGDDLNYSLNYRVPLEFPVDHYDELRDEDQIADGDFAYHVNDQIQFFGTDRFGYLRSTLRRTRADSEVAISGEPTIDESRDRVTENQASLGMAYSFSPRLVGRVVANSDFFDPTRDDRSRVYSVGTTIDALYSLTERHQVGGGFTYEFQDFSNRTDIQGSQTNSYNLFASWRWIFDPTLTFDVRVGPSYLDTRQENSAVSRTTTVVPFTQVSKDSFVQGYDKNGQFVAQPVPAGTLIVPSFLKVGSPNLNCAAVAGVPASPGCSGNIVLTDPADIDAILSNTVNVSNADYKGASDSRLTVFAEAVVTKYWSPTLSTALGYSRQQGNASGLAGTVIVDAISISNTWDFWERWQLALRGDWTRRVSAFDIDQTYDVVDGSYILPGGAFGLASRTGTAFNSSRGAEIDTNRWGVAARVTHQLFRRTSIFVQVRYDEQNSDSDSIANSSDFNDLLATFGIRYTFEPITVW